LTLADLRKKSIEKDTYNYKIPAANIVFDESLDVLNLKDYLISRPSASPERCMQALSHILKSVVLILLVVGLAKCTVNRGSGKIIPPALGDSIAFVPINNLVSNKSKYHGKWVETEAYFSFGFEESGLSYDSLIKTLDGVMKFRIHNAIWIDFISSHPFSQKLPDSINNNFVRLRGYYDTTKTGHMGLYSAELTHTYFLMTVRQASK
jgi:hypothetical protein